MNKRLNIKLLAGLFAGTLVFTVCVVLLHGFQVRRNASALLVRAEAEEQKEELEEACRILGRYLKHRPDDVEQYKKLAFLYKQRVEKDIRLDPSQFKRKVLDEALYVMEQAVRENGDDIALRREAADFWFQLRRFDDAESHLQYLLDKGVATPEDEMRFATCLQQMGGPREQEARGMLQEFVGYDVQTDTYSADKAKHPELLDAYQTLALIYDSRRDRRAAEAVLEQMVKANPADAKAYLAKARWIVRIRPEDGEQLAKEAIARAVQLGPEDVEVLVVQADLLKSEQKYDEARQVVEKALQLVDTDDRRNMARLFKTKAEMAIREKDVEGAFQILTQGLARVLRDPDLLWTKASLHVDQKQFDKMREMLSDLRKAGISDAMINYLEARVQVAEGNYLEASKVLAKVRPLLAPEYQYQVDLFLSQCYTVLGQSDNLLETLDRIIRVTPELTTALLSYAETLARLGRTSEAVATLSKAEEQLKEKGESVPPMLTTLKLDLAMKAQDKRPADERDWTEAKQLVNQIWQRDDLEPLHKLVMVVQVLIKEGDKERALTFLEKGLKEYPDQFALWQIRLDLARDAAEARDLLSKMAERFGDLVPLRIVRAKVAMKYDPPSAPEVVKAQEKGADVFEPPLRAQLYRDLASFQLAFRNRQDAVRLLELAYENNPSRLDILTSLYQLASTGNDPAALSDVVDRIEKVTTKDDDTWKMAEAGRIVWMVRNKQMEDVALSRARLMMEQVRQGRPEWIPVLLLQADIDRLQDRKDSAVQALETAYRLQPSNTSVARILSQLYQESGQVAKGLELIEKLPYSQRSNQDNRNQLQLMVQQGNLDEAMALADTVIPESAESTADLIWRSQIFQRGGRPEAAAAAARRARELQPGAPEVWTNLVSILAQQNNKAEAEAVIQDADQNLPEQIKPVILGQCHALLGNGTQAQNYLVTALRKDPDNVALKRLLAGLLLDNKQFSAAKQLLDDIVATGDAQVNEQDVQWARRSLARVWAATGSYTNFAKALGILEQNAPDGNLTGEDLTLWVSLSSLRPEAKSWQAAIDRLEQVQRTRTLTDDEKFMKVQLLEKYDERWPEVRKLAIDLLTRNAGNQRMVENWVSWLLKRKELSEADVWKKNLPTSSPTRIRVEAHVLAAQGQHRQAAQKLDALVPRELNSTQDYAYAVGIAEMAEELGRDYDKGYFLLAQRYLQRLAAKVPEQTWRLAVMMGKHGDVAEINQALAICMAPQKYNIQPALSAAKALEILQAHPDLQDTTLAPTIDKFEQWIDKQSTENPLDLALKARVAELHDWLGHFDRVEREYREILEQANGRMDPREEGMILNNLAYVMALNGKKDEPLEMIQRAAELLGPMGDLIDTRGYIRLVRGETDMAVADFQQAMQGDAKTVQKLVHLALAFDQQGDSRQAAKAWAEAQELGLDEYKLPIGLRGQYKELRAKYGNGQPSARHVPQRVRGSDEFRLVA